MARALKPVAIGVQRKHHDWSVSHARPAKNLPFSVWVVSNKTEKCIADVELRFISVNTGKEVKEKIAKRGIEVNENGTTEILSDTINTACGESYVLAARLFIDGVCISRDVDWPQPFKYLFLKDRGVTITTVGEQIHVTAKKLTKGLVFEERDGISLGDNAIDVVPGDKQIVEARGLHFIETTLISISGPR